MSTNATNVNEDRKRLKELLSDASELLKKQEQQKKRVKNPENTADLDDETEFLRNSLKDVYEDILLIDLKIANEHNIEEKLWRNVFYSHIEELRQKLRKIKPEKAEYQTTYLELCRYLDLGTGFYHTIVNSLKIRENIDLDWIGIEIFKNSVNSSATATRSASKYRRRELTVECIQRCLIHLGDFARYRETSLDANEKRWEFARHFYTKAARVYCENGKAQAQLALLAMYDDNELDVVYWYCFSLSTKQPSGISLENLKVFYSKFAQKARQINEDTNDTLLTVQDFVKKFMIIHWYIFEENVENLIKNGGIEDIFHYFGSSLSSSDVNLRNLNIILKKVVFILMFTIWDLRKGLVQDRIVIVRNLQAMAIGLVFGFLVPVVENIYSFLSSEDVELGCIGSVVDLFLPTVVLWCEYLRTLTDLLSQLYDHSKSIDKENQKIFGMFLMNSKNFFKSLINILNHQKISNLLSANDDLYEIAKLALSEDREFLGIVPLRVVHQDINFNVSGKVDVLKVSIARLIVFSKKISEIKSLALLEYNESSGQFMMIDEELKKKERQRVMRLMAHRFLQDQVNSLEDKVKNIKPLQSSSTGSSALKNSKANTLIHCVADISVFLNHLNSVKKWIAEEKCIVIVPLDVIDSLDTIKKGNNKENARARDAIRFLDEQLDQQFSKAKQNESELFIRAQKTNEKLPQWNCAENYIIKDGMLNDNSRGVVYKDQKYIKESSKNSDNIYIQEDKFNVMDVPLEYRPAISCWLYYAKIVKIDEILFVSEDQYLKNYAKMFGISVVGVGFI